MEEALESSVNCPPGFGAALPLPDGMEPVPFAARRQPRLSPLSFGQERLWFLDQLEPGRALYNIPMAARLLGKLNGSALRQSLNALVARHEALRTRFVWTGKAPAQAIDEAARVDVVCQDLTPWDSARQPAEVERLIHQEVNRPFNLSADRLIRGLLLQLKAEEHVLVLTAHHIVSDEWSLEILWRELTALYESFLHRGAPAALPPLPIQYADYALWQRQLLEVYERQSVFWKEQLGGGPPVLELPADHPRRPVDAFAGATLSRPIGKGLGLALKQVADRSKATLYMALLAAFKTLLYRYTQQEDLIVATPVAGRTRVETEGLIGFFVNTLPLRTRLFGGLTFAEALARVRQTALGAFGHQDLPFEKLVEALHPERSLEHLPFTRVMFLSQKPPPPPLHWPDLDIHFFEVATDTAKFDLTFGVQESKGNLTARAEFSTSRFETATISRLLSHFETLLEGVAARPSLRLSELPLLKPAEQHQLLAGWNDTRTDYPRDASISQLFEAQAVRAPQAVAVVFGEQSLTYAALNERANQIARTLQTRFHVGPDVPVGICLERSVEMVVGLLGILKAGGAYVPLDPAYPKERLAFMLADTQAPVLLTRRKLIDLLPQTEAPMLLLDEAVPRAVKWGKGALEFWGGEWEEDTSYHTHLSSPTPPLPSSLAYILYTSGTTGRPKGAAVPHRAVVRLVRETNYIRFDSSDRVAQVSNMSFDAATFEIWGALLNGGCLVGIPQEVILSPADFARQLRAQGITAMFLTAALFNQLAARVPGAFETLRTLIVGGEALDPNSVRAVLKQLPPQRLVNGYGPTENTTFTCCYLIQDVPENATNVPIGRPISNTQVYILDPQLNPAPVGVPGELHCGGDGLARGYWHRPELTAEKFIADPFDPQGGGRLYKTGDLARYLPDGSIEYLGRMDQQVKIRGFRIELGEIEAVLGSHPGVKECALAAWKDNAGSKRLAAYVVANGLPPGAPELRAFLGQRLPEYMLPSVFVPLAALPLTPNGKLDRKALPEPDGARSALETRHAPPRDAVEKRLVGIWEEVLGVHPIGINDKFFELGGHSLLAVRLVAEIEQAFERKLRLATIFQAPSVEQLAAVLREEIKEACVAGGSSVVEIQPRGSRPPLFLVHGAGGGMFWGYANLARHLGPDQPVYGFKSPGLSGGEEFARLEQMAAQYVADLRAVQPSGPYYLGGYCFGGDVAFEMARQLSADGQPVALVVLMNSVAPNSRYCRIPWTPLWALRLLRNLPYCFGYFLSWTGPQRRGFFRWKWTQFKKKLALRRDPAAARLSRADVGDLVDFSAFTAEERQIWEAHIRTLLGFTPKPFGGRVHLLRSPGHPLWCSFDPSYGWADYALGGMGITIVPGAHERILEEPFVQTLAGELAKALENAAGSLPVSSKEAAPLPAPDPQPPQLHPVLPA